MAKQTLIHLKYLFLYVFIHTYVYIKTNVIMEINIERKQDTQNPVF